MGPTFIIVAIVLMSLFSKDGGSIDGITTSPTGKVTQKGLCYICRLVPDILLHILVHVGYCLDCDAKCYRGYVKWCFIIERACIRGNLGSSAYIRGIGLRWTFIFAQHNEKFMGRT